jgi:hypothetical protein
LDTFVSQFGTHQL